MKTEADFWACRVCRSINGLRADRCYSCHTPREVAAVKPTDLSKLGPLETWTYKASNGSVVFVVVGDTVTLQATGAAPPKETK